jgi:hypothetical protein
VDILERIKQLASRGRVTFTKKARFEMAIDNLTPELVKEAIDNATAISKTLRSKNPQTGVAEKLYIIKAFTSGGIFIYTKGKIDKLENKEVFYVLISSKRSSD